MEGEGGGGLVIAKNNVFGFQAHTLIVKHKSDLL